jgi:acyl dehydratase
MALDLSLVGRTSDEVPFRYTSKDTILYALGVGAQAQELDYLYEGRGPKVLPSFAVVPTFKPMLDFLSQLGGDLSMVVHHGEKVVIHRPLGPAGELRTQSTLKQIYDLRRFAIVVVETALRDADGTLVAETTSSILFRGEGGFGGPMPPKDGTLPAVPKDRAPDFEIRQGTAREQALLYRLSGDVNPLHADPEVAARVGFERGPILHGLCTFGHMVRHAMQGLGEAGVVLDAARVSAFEAQFKKPVWPGETFLTQGFILKPGTVALQVKTVESGEPVLGNAWLRYRANP